MKIRNYLFNNKYFQNSVNYHKNCILHRNDSQKPAAAIDTITEKTDNQVSRSYRKGLTRNLLNGPNLKDFFKNEHLKDLDHIPDTEIPYLRDVPNFGNRKKVYFDVYGCQQNMGDTEIIWSILKSNNYLKTVVLEEADIMLMVTCAIREGAEAKVWKRLDYLKGIRNKRRKMHGVDTKIGILGCMAERLKEKVLEIDKSVDVIAGPDSYKDLPRLLTETTANHQTAINVALSLDETYADIMPVRLDPTSKSGYVSIMRGCDNMCTYCIVPFTRGRERSRPIASIRKEVQELSEQGIREITLLGQNVNSYRDLSEANDLHTCTNLVPGFKTVYKTKVGGKRFAELLDTVAEVNPEIRIRFTSPHPKDFPDEVLQVIRDRPNICKNLHLPAQSGSSTMLDRMRRGYTREAYLDLVQHIRSTLPTITFSSDFICGFCGETEEEFADTLSLMDIVRYNTAYVYPYSMREKTTAHRRFEDNVSKKIKQQRVDALVKLYRKHAQTMNLQRVGQLQLLLVEGTSKRSDRFLAGRNDNNIKVIIPRCDVPEQEEHDDTLSPVAAGDYVVVQINAANSQVLKGIPLYKSSISAFHKNDLSYEEQYCYNSML